MTKSIFSFKLRAGYPNYRCSAYFCKEYLNNNATANDLPGFNAPQIEYTTGAQSSPQTINAHFTDMPFLCDPDKQKAAAHLLLLVNAQEGDTLAQAKLEKIKTDYWKKQQKLFASHDFTEDPYVIPSVTKTKYNDKQVSHKGANLLDLTKEGYPVPDFCVLTAKGFPLPAGKRSKHLKTAIENLEKLTGNELGSPSNPLIFAMRCALPEYVPGLMPTYLNVGVTENIYPELIKKYGSGVAQKIYYNSLKTIYNTLFPEYGEGTFTKAREPRSDELEDTEKMIDFYYYQIAGNDKNLLTDAYYQYEFFIRQAGDFYHKNQDLIYTFQKGEKTFPSVILQKMVWTVRDEDSYPGVLYSRHSRTGLGVQIESLKNIFGEDIMSGLINTEHTEFFVNDEIKDKFPAVYHFCPNIPLLEKKLRSPATVEFAAESFNDRHYFAVLQLDNAELTGRATLLSAIDMYKDKTISEKEVVKLIRPYHLRQIFSERIDDESLKKLQYFSTGISILPRSAVSARLFFSATEAIEAKKKGDRVCFCKSTFTPVDRIVMSEVDAIASLTPAAIHVVTACLGYGIPALINLEKYGAKIIVRTLVNDKGQMINEGDWITISSKRRALFIGKASYKPARFQKYLEGQKLELEPKEEKVFVNMARAFKEYQTIVDSLESGDITKLSDLVKLIRNDLQKYPKKAEKFVNKWFDDHTEYYIHQILKSELGSHLDQHRIYSLLSTDRRVRFFRSIIELCKGEKLKGFKAGAFMLGRFMSLPHSLAFWKELNAGEILFLLNEYVLFEKYLQVLNDNDERHINRVRNEILSYGLGSISISKADAEIFISLKLHMKDWEPVNDLYDSSFDKETGALLDLLQLPYGQIYDYNAPWSVDKLKEVCRNEKVNFPDKESI